jgi:hypothetical protein
MPYHGFLLPFRASVLPQPRPRLSLPLRLDQLDYLLRFFFGFSHCLPESSNHSLHIFLDGDSWLSKEISTIWMWQCCTQLCYQCLQHFVEVQLVMDCHCEAVHLTIDAFQDPIIGK